MIPENAKNAKYILASDFDHTLAKHPEPIDEKTISNIARLRRLGGLFGIVTGRSYTAIIQALRECGFDEYDFIICTSGAFGVWRDDSVIFEERISAAVLPALMTYMRDSSARYASFDVAREFYSVDIGSQRLEHEIPFEALYDFDYFTFANTGYMSDEKAHSALTEMKSLFGDFINPQQNSTNVDIPPAGIDKGVAVEKLRKICNVPTENVFTVGDNLNDLPMIGRFYGFAVDNAKDELKSAARHVCCTVGDCVDIILN